MVPSRLRQPSRAAGRGRGGRGAALVEYVLLLSVFVVAVVYSLDLINEEVEEDASETAYQIGGVTGSTVPADDGGGGDGGGGDGGGGDGGVDAGDDAGADDGLASDNEAPVVYAGPDRVVSPSRTLWTAQSGTVSDSDTPAGLLEVSWSSSSGSLPTLNRTHSGGNTSIDFRSERPGTYSLTLQADDGYLTGSDTAQVKVTSGIVTSSSVTMTGWWTDHRLLTWNARARLRITNPFGWPMGGLTVSGRWTFSGAPAVNVSCTTDSNGYCTLTRNSIASTVTQACFALVNVTGPAGCFDGWDGTTRSGCISRGSLTIPTTTTTTTRPPTTTTRPPSTTTTTRPGGTTTTTRPPSTTTTTRPPTTTTTRPPTTTTTISL